MADEVNCVRHRPLGNTDCLLVPSCPAPADTCLSTVTLAIKDWMGTESAKEEGEEEHSLTPQPRTTPRSHILPESYKAPLGQTRIRPPGST